MQYKKSSPFQRQRKLPSCSDPYIKIPRIHAAQPVGQVIQPKNSFIFQSKQHNSKHNLNMTSINPLIRGIQQINQEGRMALCGYFLTGYSTPKNFYHCIRALHNIDVFEFGIPSENPYMDGPIISSAHRHVTENLGVDAEVALSLLGGLKSLAQPRFVMTYTQDGRKLDGFLRLCLLNGIHGVVAPDVRNNFV